MIYVPLEQDFPRDIYIDEIREQLQRHGLGILSDLSPWLILRIVFHARNAPVETRVVESQDVNLGRRIHTLPCGCFKRATLHRVECPTKPNGLIDLSRSQP